MTETRRQRLWLLGASAVVAVAIVVIAIAIGNAGSGRSGTTKGAPQGAVDARSLFAGIPQRGVVLGSPRAPVTVTEFADLQCPFCGDAARSQLPGIVSRYVRPGRVKLVFRNLAFLGPDSLRGARFAAAAGLQNRLWQFVELVYRNQGEENSGWVTDAYLRRVAASAGLDVSKAFAQRGSAAAAAQLSEAKAAAKAAGVSETPTFIVSRPGAKPLLASADGLSSAIDGALKGQ